MRPIRRLRRQGKAFSQPPFWAQNTEQQMFHFSSTVTSDRETIEHDWQGYVNKLLKDNGVVFACIQTRMMVFSEARFTFQKIENGRPGEFYGTPKKDESKLQDSNPKPKTPGTPAKPAAGSEKPKPTPKFADPGKKPTDTDKKPKTDEKDSEEDAAILKRLDILHHPWPGGQTDDLLAIMEMDASLAGNAYITTVNDEGKYGNAAKGSETARLHRMRPNCVEIVIHSPTGNPWALDAKIAGFLYKPIAGSKDGWILLLPDEVAHYKPIPDPIARFRGMSWLTPVIREALADRSAMEHKKTFFDSGATLGHVVTLSETVSPDDFDEFVARFRASHEGVDNAYKTLILGGGADVTTVGADFKQLDFTQTQGHGETRIAAASGVPPVIVGLSEGLQAATYSNYGQARRRFADGTLRPLWRMAAGALSVLVDVPEDARLWFDDRDISFLRDDQLDEANIMQIDATALKSLVEAGFEPETAVMAVNARDVTLLEHSGMVSVQLFPPGMMGMQPMGGTPGSGQPGNPAGQAAGGGAQGGGKPGGAQKPGAGGAKPTSPSKPKPSSSGGK